MPPFTMKRTHFQFNPKKEVPIIEKDLHKSEQNTYCNFVGGTNESLISTFVVINRRILWRFIGHGHQQPFSITVT